ncbi:hypothetical protein NIES2119_00575 [[Phormidium ambiguum] IAM M-71]|uniref:DUF5666 domain-containing protein n=1 Tax=[Phormidium ambiguum] IAM M-71 TaxID=454136 RepID=A0A1U7ITP2_9CYAN|nr:hypothetical protein [Phormidium ambiguum]OKH40842.1 hypothetical protein NIES2119_00575 [Phormidium ambiguum IAM M-71]
MELVTLAPQNTGFNLSNLYSGMSISGTVVGLIDNGDDFILQRNGGGQIVIDPEPLRANQLGLIPGEQVNVIVAEWDDFEVDTFTILRTDGSAILGNLPIDQNPNSQFDSLTGQWFDAAQYLNLHPDVAAAEINPLSHFLNYGAVEGRMPALFDDNFYLATNPDVKVAKDNGFFSSGWEHYKMFGAKEGRIGSAFSSPTLVQQMANSFAVLKQSVTNITPVNSTFSNTNPVIQWGISNISGTVTAVFNDEFILSMGNQQVLVDADRPRGQRLNLVIGEQVTVFGELDDDEFDAFSITKADGSITQIRSRERD